MRNYREFCERGRQQYGSKFDTRDLDPKFIPYYESGQRIKVESFHATACGTVGVTTGWRPVFLLMRRTTAKGSSYTLGKTDRIVAEQVRGKYREVRP